MQVDSGAAIGLGTISVAAGATLRVDGVVAESANTATLTTGSPGARLTGTGTVRRSVFANSGSRIEPGNSVGNLTVSSITLNGATLNFETGAGNTIDKLIVLGTASFVTANSTLNLSGPFIAGGTYDFITYTAKAGALPTGVTLGTTPGGPFTYTLGFDSDSYFVTIAQTGNDYNWDIDSGTAGAQDGSSPPNWTNTVSVWDNILATNATWGNATTNAINFGGIGGAGPFAVTIDGNKTAASLNFTKNYALSPLTTESISLQNGISASSNATVGVPVTMLANNSVSVGAGATLNVTAGIGENTAGLTLTKNGAGTLVLGGTAGYTGATNLNGGTTAVSAANQLSSANINLGGGTLLATADFFGAQQVSLTGTDNGLGAATGVTMTRAGGTAATTGGFTKIGGGTVLFTAPINNTGGVGVAAGTLALGTGATIPAVPNITLANGGTISFVNASNNTVSGAVTSPAGSGINLGANSTLTLTGSTARVVNSTITGAGALAWNPSSGAGMTLGAANAFAGGVSSNNNGTFTLTNASGFGSGPVALGSTAANTPLTFTLGAGSFEVPNNIAFGSIGANIGSISHAVSGQTVVLSGQLSGGNATGTLRLAGAASNDDSVIKFTNATNNLNYGTLVVYEGQLAITSNAALGNAGTVQLNSTTDLTTGFGGLRLDANDITVTKTINVVDTNFIHTQANNGTISGLMVNSGTLGKSGSGRLSMTNTANTYTGTISVIGGELNLRGPGVVLPTSSNIITVNNGATISGDGTANRPVTIAAGGTIAPGNSIGTLTIGAISLGGVPDANPANNSMISIEVDESTAQADKLMLNNGATQLNFNGTTLRFVFVNGTITNPFYQSFVVVQNAGTVAPPTGTPNFEVVLPIIVAGFVDYALAYVNNDGGAFANDVQVTFTAVPEPSSLAALAFAGLLLRRTRRTA